MLLKKYKQAMNFMKMMVLNKGIHPLQQVCKQIHIPDRNAVNCRVC